MRRKDCSIVLGWVVSLVPAAVAPAGFGLEVIGPFNGDASESFEGFPFGGSSSLPIFGGAGFMQPAFITSASTFMGSTISAHSPIRFSHVTGPVQFTFAEPIEAFGGYIATNSGASGGTVELYGLDDQLIDVVALDVTFVPGPAPYTWNGWLSDVPITRVRFSSNGVLNGFLGFDDLEVSFVIPAPGGALLLLPGALVTRRRRRSGAAA